MFYQLPEASGCLIPGREVELDLDRSHGNIIGTVQSLHPSLSASFCSQSEASGIAADRNPFLFFYLFQASKEGRDACL